MVSRFLISIFLLFSLTVHAFTQTSPADLKTFDKDGLKFSYPGDWTLTDRSDIVTQYLMLGKEGSVVLLAVVSPRESITGESHFRTLLGNVHRSYLGAIRTALSTNDLAAKHEGMCLEWKGRKINGTRFSGVYNNQESIGDIYPFAVNGRLVALIYMRVKKDEETAKAGWQNLLDTLAVENRSDPDLGFTFVSDTIDGGVLNGMALKLVKPEYPSAARKERAQGPISVKVLIDENGDVISTEASPGNAYLQNAARIAARKSKFLPTMICGRPIRVTGVITYNFVR
jgi:TonB family protein